MQPSLFLFGLHRLHWTLNWNWMFSLSWVGFLSQTLSTQTCHLSHAFADEIISTFLLLLYIWLHSYELRLITLLLFTHCKWLKSHSAYTAFCSSTLFLWVGVDVITRDVFPLSLKLSCVIWTWWCIFTKTWLVLILYPKVLWV